MRILIIGSSGFIGRQLVRGLEVDGYRFDISSRNVSNQRPGIVYFDFQSRKTFKNACDYDIIIMTAFDHKYTGNVSFIKYLKEQEFSGKLVYLSTISALDWKKLSQDRLAYSKSLEIYSWVKRKCEKLIIGSKMTYCIIRPSVVLGGGTWHSIFGAINDSDKAFIPNEGNNFCYFVNVSSVVKLIIDNLDGKENLVLNGFGELKTWKSLITTKIYSTNSNRYCDSRLKNLVFRIIYNTQLGLLIQYMLKRFILSHGGGKNYRINSYEATNTVRNLMSINFRLK